VVAKLQKGFTLMLLRPIAASIPNYVHTSRSITLVRSPLSEVE